MDEIADVSECDCADCRSACERKPGWFAPGEAETAAALKSMPMPEFFRRYLGVDWWEEIDGQTFLLSPATTGMDPGEEFPSDPRGRCVFLQEGRCSIYAARPSECRFSHHTNSHEGHKAKREGVVDKWRSRQNEVTALLGREPSAASLGFLGMFSLLGS